VAMIDRPPSADVMSGGIVRTRRDADFATRSHGAQRWRQL